VAVATGPGRGDDSWDAWLALVEELWRRWPHRRRGLVGLELRAGRPRRVEDQGSLFPDPAAAGRMRLTAGWRRLAGGGLRFASEAVLVDWGIRWDEAPPPAEALVDACQADR
jgi:hypothetical protein